MLEKLSHDDKVRFVYDVAHAMHRAGEPRSGIELVVLLTRWLKVESNDFLDFARTQPKSHVFEHFLDRYPQPSLDAFRSRKTK